MQTSDPSVPPHFCPTPPASPTLPTYEALDGLPLGERALFRGVDWAFYERLLEVAEDRKFQIAFDGRDLEVMPIGPLHALVACSVASLLETITEELEIQFTSLGATTWMRPSVKRGIEADMSYYFLPEKLRAAGEARTRRSDNLADYPDPDLAIEIDIPPPRVDRLGIYAALQVAEVWRIGDHGVAIDRLSDQGSYVAAHASGFLPIRNEEVARWVLEEYPTDVLAWKRRLRAWVLAALVARRAS